MLMDLNKEEFLCGVRAELTLLAWLVQVVACCCNVASSWYICFATNMEKAHRVSHQSPQITRI